MDSYIFYGLALLFVFIILPILQRRATSNLLKSTSKTSNVFKTN